MSGTWCRTPWENTRSTLWSGKGIAVAEPRVTSSYGSPKLETERHTPHGFVRHVHPGPPGTPADQPLRLGPLAETDLEHPLAPHVEFIEASGDVALQAITVRVVGSEECGVVSPKPLVQAAGEVVTAGVRLPEIGDRSLRNDFHPRHLQPRSPLDHDVSASEPQVAHGGPGISSLSTYRRGAEDPG